MCKATVQSHKFWWRSLGLAYYYYYILYISDGVGTKGFSTWDRGMGVEALIGKNTGVVVELGIIISAGQSNWPKFFDLLWGWGDVKLQLVGNGKLIWWYLELNFTGQIFGWYFQLYGKVFPELFILVLNLSISLFIHQHLFIHWYIY